MSPPCLFNLENYDCEGTDVQRCIFVLSQKMNSMLTPEGQRKIFPQCAKKIKRKANENAIHQAEELLAQARIKPKNIVNEGIEKIDLNHSLPGLNPNDWKNFLNRDSHKVNPFPLAIFLNDRWKVKRNSFQTQRITERVQLRTIDDIKQIIAEIKKAYPNDGENQSFLIQEIENEMQVISLKFLEKNIRQKANELSTQKKWHQLMNYIQRNHRREFSKLFRDELLKLEELADKGITWLNAKNKFLEFSSRFENYELDSLIAEFSAQLELFQFAFSERYHWGNQEENKMLLKGAEEFYNHCIELLKKSSGTSDEIYIFMVEHREKFQVVFSNPPQKWFAFRDSLRNKMIENYSQELQYILQSSEDFDRLNHAIDSLKTKVQQVKLDGNLQEIESIRQNLDKLKNMNDFLESILDQKDPYRFCFENQSFQEIAIQLGKLDKIASQWAIFKRIKRSLQEGSNLFSHILHIIDQFNEIIRILGGESGKILDNNLEIDFSNARAKLDEVDEQTARIWSSNSEIHSLEILSQMVQVYGYYIFSTPQMMPDDPTNYQEIDLFKRIKELIDKGTELEKSLESINSQPNKDPMELLEIFQKTINEFREKEFVFSQISSHRIKKVIQRIKNKIERLINEELTPMKKELTPLIPVLSMEKLENYSRELDKLKLKMPASYEQFKGYDEISLRFKGQVDELSCLVKVHQYINRNHFEEAEKFIEALESIRIPFKNNLLACVYYYRYLDKKDWHDESWFRFFQYHSAVIINYQGEKETSGVLKEYALLFDTNFLNIPPHFLSRHYSIFKENLSESLWMPYLSYLSGSCNVKKFSKTVCSGEKQQVHFPRFLQYLKENKMWPQFLEVYHACGDQLKPQFEEKPLTEVHHSLKKEYEGVKNDFISSCSIELDSLKELRQKIPKNNEFSEMWEKYEEISDLQKCFREVQQNLSSYRNFDIWRDKDFEIQLMEIDNKSNCFSEDFKEIRNKMNWSTIIRSLKHLYLEGNKIIEKFQWREGKVYGYDYPLVSLEFHKSKASHDFSDKLVEFLQSVLELWDRFQETLKKLPDQYLSLQDVFDREYFRSIFNIWSKTSFWKLWEERELPVPQCWNNFVNMLKRILQNHEEYIRIIENEDPLKIESQDIIDPYIMTHQSHQRNNRF